MGEVPGPRNCFSTSLCCAIFPMQMCVQELCHFCKFRNHYVLTTKSMYRHIVTLSQAPPFSYSTQNSIVLGPHKTAGNIRHNSLLSCLGHSMTHPLILLTPCMNISIISTYTACNMALPDSA